MIQKGLPFSRLPSDYYCIPNLVLCHLNYTHFEKNAKSETNLKKKMDFVNKIVLIGLMSIVGTIYAAPARDNSDFEKYADMITQMLGGL